MVKRLAALLPVMVLLGLCFAPSAFAESSESLESCKDACKVMLTFKNGTAQKVQVAVLYRGFDTPDDRKVGWYIIDAGASRAITLPVHPKLTMEGTGYYAQSQPGPGQKTIYWRGDFKKYSVPDVKFNAPPDENLPGGKQVGFRKIELSHPREDTHATAVINLNERTAADSAQ